MNLYLHHYKSQQLPKAQSTHTIWHCRVLHHCHEHTVYVHLYIHIDFKCIAVGEREWTIDLVCFLSDLEGTGNLCSSTAIHDMIVSDEVANHTQCVVKTPLSLFDDLGKEGGAGERA